MSVLAQEFPHAESWPMTRVKLCASIAMWLAALFVAFWALNAWQSNNIRKTLADKLAPLRAEPELSAAGRTLGGCRFQPKFVIMKMLR